MSENQTEWVQVRFVQHLSFVTALFAMQEGNEWKSITIITTGPLARKVYPLKGDAVVWVKLNGIEEMGRGKEKRKVAILVDLRPGKPT